MTVQDLIELLQRCGPGKEVHVLVEVTRVVSDGNGWMELKETDNRKVDEVREEINRVIIYGS